MTEYKDKIATLLDDIATAADNARHPLSVGMFTYVSDVRTRVNGRLSYFNDYSDHIPVLLRFKTFIDAEEKRLREALEVAKYDIDSFETLSCIHGHRGLERVRIPYISKITWNVDVQAFSKPEPVPNHIPAPSSSLGSHQVGKDLHCASMGDERCSRHIHVSHRRSRTKMRHVKW